MMKRILIAGLLLCLCLTCASALEEHACWRIDEDTGGAMGITFVDVQADEIDRIICLWPNQEVTGVTLAKRQPDGSWLPLWQAEAMASNTVLRISADIPDGEPNLRVTCTDELGYRQVWYISDSGEDGHPLLLRVIPEALAVPGGELISVRYSCSGDENGNRYELTLHRMDDGSLMLQAEENECWNEPLLVSRYRMADDSLSRIAALVRANDMVSWSERPDWLFVCDAAQPSLHLRIMDEEGDMRSCHISGYIHMTDAETEAWRQVLSILREHKKDAFLIEQYTVMPE